MPPSRLAYQIPDKSAVQLKARDVERTALDGERQRAGRDLTVLERSDLRRQLKTHGRVTRGVSREPRLP